jgi:cell division protein YceG involved in septum cleavage
LQAAASPRASEYLFYVMSPKLNRHRFAKTFDEHRRNIALAKVEAKALEAQNAAQTATS